MSRVSSSGWYRYTCESRQPFWLVSVHLCVASTLLVSIGTPVCCVSPPVVSSFSRYIPGPNLTNAVNRRFAVTGALSRQRPLTNAVDIYLRHLIHDMPYMYAHSRHFDCAFNMDSVCKLSFNDRTDANNQLIAPSSAALFTVRFATVNAKPSVLFWQ